MDISKTIAEMKNSPQFAENGGMVLVHNGVVRSWARKGGEEVRWLEVRADRQKIGAIRQEYLKRPGIFDIVVAAASGRFKPGDDLREHVRPVLAELLDRIKAEAVSKREIAAP